MPELACPECDAIEFTRDAQGENRVEDNWYCTNGHLQPWSVVNV